MSQPETAAMPPFLEIKHLLPIGKIAVSCQGPPTAAQSKAPIGSQEAASQFNFIIFCHKKKNDIYIYEKENESNIELVSIIN